MSPNLASIEEQIRARLQKLAPTTLHIEDESAQHAGHAGASSGGHYRLTIVSANFSGQTAVQRHRLVYTALGELMQNGIHALALQTYAPDEF